MSVTILIPTIPTRTELLGRAVASALRQDVPGAVMIETDWEGEGPAAIRNRMIASAETEYVAFLDDDDEIDPSHIGVLLAAARESGADVVYPKFRWLVDGRARRRGVQDHLGRPFDPADLRRGNFIPVTVLARRSALVEVGGFPIPGTADWPGQDAEDYGLWLRLLDGGCKFSHVNRVTWSYHNHSARTLGRPWKTGYIAPMAVAPPESLTHRVRQVLKAVPTLAKAGNLLNIVRGGSHGWTSRVTQRHRL